MVTLLPPTTGASVELTIEALTEGPRFVRTARMSRWHRPRNGTRYPEGRTVYGCWCGYSVGGSDKAGVYLEADEPPEGEPVCATCEGRAAGAGQDASPTGRLLLFSPRELDPPKTCPGSRSSVLLEPLRGGRAARCLACADVHPIRAMGGPYNPRCAIVQHPPGPGLVTPCPFHRWKQLTATDGRVHCHCGRDCAPPRDRLFPDPHP